MAPKKVAGDARHPRLILSGKNVSGDKRKVNNV